MESDTSATLLVALITTLNTHKESQDPQAKVPIIGRRRKRKPEVNEECQMTNANARTSQK